MLKLSRKSFDLLVEEAIDSLPEDFAAWLDEVPIIVEDRPGRADQQDPDEEAPLGLYAGHSLLEGRHSGDLPPRVMIYREPLLDMCESREQLAQEIFKTLVHELGHHAGMDEEQLEALGYGPPEEEIDFDLDAKEDDERT